MIDGTYDTESLAALAQSAINLDHICARLKAMPTRASDVIEMLRYLGEALNETSAIIGTHTTDEHPVSKDALIVASSALRAAQMAGEVLLAARSRRAQTASKG